MWRWLFAPAVCIAACSTVTASTADGDARSDVTMTWVEKYVTYRQNHRDELSLTDVHFLAEIIFDGDHDFDAIEAAVYENNSAKPLATYGGADKRAFTNGLYYTRKTRSFDAPEDLERRHPADTTFVWTISGPSGEFELDPIRIGGTEGETRVPAVSTIRLRQNDERVADYEALDPSQPLTISWDPFTIGSPLEGTEWNDWVFVLVSDCSGNVVYTSGAPEDDDFVDYTETSATAPAGRLQPGQRYVVFISQVNTVDHNISHGITQLAANSFATELPVRTRGATKSDICAGESKPAQYLWTRKTRGDAMETWPTVADYW